MHKCKGPWWSQSEGRPCALAARASMVPKRRRPYAHAAGVSLLPMQRRPPRPCGGASVVPKQIGPPPARGEGLGAPNWKDAPTPLRRGPRWSESEGGPGAYTAGALVVFCERGSQALVEGDSVVPKRRRPPRRLHGGVLGGPL